MARDLGFFADFIGRIGRMEYIAHCMICREITGSLRNDTEGSAILNLTLRNYGSAVQTAVWSIQSASRFSNPFFNVAG